MPKLNADEVVFEPIEVILNGKTYAVKEVTQEMFDKIGSLGAETKDLKVVSQQLGVVFGVPSEEFDGLDLRKLNGVVRFVTTAIGEQVQGKNV